MNFLFDFSWNHCITICAFLVPANLLLTLRTLYLITLRQPSTRVYYSAFGTVLFAVTLLWHDFTWFRVGVVMAPTYILLTLACICLSLTIGAIVHPTSMKQCIKAFMAIGHKNVAILTNQLSRWRMPEHNYFIQYFRHNLHSFLEVL